jgi:predicted dehydrogenase/threonine dehydrogenase-like Zn-dependent dehydrogenase
MKQIAQNYRSGELALLDVPAPACRPGGVLVRTAYSVVSAGTEMMKISESKLSLIGKARARPDQVRKVMRSLRQQGVVSTCQKVINRLDSYTPLGYSLSGVVTQVGEGIDDIAVGQRVACAGNQYALHAEYNWVPATLCVPIPPAVGLDQAAFTTVGAVALQGLRQAEIGLGETACVIGLGLLGQILVRLLRGAGARVTGIDILADRCRLAEAAGAAACAVPGSPGYEIFYRQIAELSGGNGIDCIFLTTGGKDNRPVELAAELARDRARIVDIGKCSLNLPWKEYYEKELEVRFSRSYGPGRYDPTYEEGGIDYPIGYVRWTERRNMACILDLMAEGRLDLGPLITEIFPLDSALDTYRRMERGELSSLGVLFQYRDDAPATRQVASAPRRRPAAGPATRTMRLGVIGAGNYASSMLLPQLAADAEVSLIEVVTNTALSSANAARKFGFARASTDVAALFGAEDIDAVLIATRHASHSALVCAAIRAGKAVFVEKPLAISREGLSDIIRTVGTTGTDRVMVGFGRRFAPLSTRLKGEWGRRAGPHIVNYRINAGPLEDGSWYSRTDTEGSRAIGEAGHFIDTVSWWLDADPVEVFAVATPGNPDNLCATLRYPDGSLATIGYLTEGDPRFPKEALEIFGDAKAASFDNFCRFELWSRGRRTRRRGWLDKGQRNLLTSFTAAVRTGAPMPIAFGSLVATTAATLALQESAGTKKPVSIADYLDGLGAAPADPPAEPPPAAPSEALATFFAGSP